MSRGPGRLAALLVLVVALLAPSTAQASLARYQPDDARWYSALRLDEVHRETTGKGVKVAIIDGSIDLTVPELRGADITLGRSVTGKKSVSVPGAGAANHGTAMTVLVAGQGNGGVTGVAPDAEVTFYQANRDPYTDSLASPAALIEQAARDGADVISVSLASGDADENDPAVREAIAAGAVVVAGGGEAGSPGISSPASAPGVVAVGAADRNAKAWSEQPGQRDDLSATLAITAPGVEVPAGASSTERRGAVWTPAYPRTGTSPATAITAGALALVKQKFPDATGNQLVQQLIHSTGRSGDADYFGWERPNGFGILSVRNMLERDPTGWPDENPLTRGVEAAVKTYPLSVYGDSADPAPSAETTTSPAAADTTDAAADDGTGPLPWVLGAVAVLVLVTAGIVVARRHHRPSEEA